LIRLSHGLSSIEPDHPMIKSSRCRPQLQYSPTTNYRLTRPETAVRPAMESRAVHLMGTDVNEDTDLDETSVGEQQQEVTAEESTANDEEVDQPGLNSAPSTSEAVTSSEPALQPFELSFATAAVQGSTPTEDPVGQQVTDQASPVGGSVIPDSMPNETMTTGNLVISDEVLTACEDVVKT